jgi:hypothetical protein
MNGAVVIAILKLRMKEKKILIPVTIMPPQVDSTERNNPSFWLHLDGVLHHQGLIKKHPTNVTI